MAGGGCGRRPDGRHFAPGKFVASGCNTEGYVKEGMLMGGGGRMEEVTRIIRNRESDYQGVEAPWTLSLAQKYTWQRYQELEYDRIQRITQGRRGGGKGETEGPAMDEPPRC